MLNGLNLSMLGRKTFEDSFRESHVSSYPNAQENAIGGEANYNIHNVKERELPFSISSNWLQGSGHLYELLICFEQKYLK